MSDLMVYVRLKIMSDTLTPERISAILGIKPSKVWHVGDRRGPSTIREKTDGWLLESDLPRNTPLEKHVARLLARLAPFADRIESLAEENVVEFSCVVYAKDPPSLNFEKLFLRQIANLGASLDIDLYLGD